MYKKTCAVLVAVASLCVANMAWAQSEVALRNVETVVQQQRVQAAVQALKDYRTELSQLSEPQSEAILGVIEKLTVYNAAFAQTGNEGAKYDLASELNSPVKVKWNTYRGNALIEIFDTYVDNSHGNKAVADLEYYIKLYTLPRLTVRHAAVVGKEFSSTFNKAYGKFQQDLLNIKSYSVAEIAKAVVSFGKVYNSVYNQKGFDKVSVLHDTSFVLPNKTGWDKSVSVKDLLGELGIEYSAGWDDLRYRSTQEVAEMYNLSEQDADVLTTFVARVLQGQYYQEIK